MRLPVGFWLSTNIPALSIALMKLLRLMVTVPLSICEPMARLY